MARKKTEFENHDYDDGYMWEDYSWQLPYQRGRKGEDRQQVDDREDYRRNDRGKGSDIGHINRSRDYSGRSTNNAVNRRTRSNPSSVQQRNNPGNQRPDNREEYNKKRRHPILKSFFAVLFSAFIILGAVFIFISTNLLSKVNQKDITSDLSALGVVSGVVFDDKIKNIALFGLDSRDEESFEGRSDAIMILSIDGVNKKIKLTSLLRDSLVEIDGHGMDKLAHAYSYGGPELGIKTINKNYKLNISDYATVNFYKMAEIVDAFNGTELYITEDEMYEINANLDLLQFDDPNAVVNADDYIYDYGDVVLNGVQAVAFARIRSLDGDVARTSRQQEVMKGMMARINDLSLNDYLGLAKTVLPMCETSLNIEEITGLVPALTNHYNMETLSIPGEFENPENGYTNDGSWVFVYDLADASNHIDAFIKEYDSKYWDRYNFVVTSNFE